MAGTVGNRKWLPQTPQLVVRCHTKYTLLGGLGLLFAPKGIKSSLPSARCQSLRRLQAEKEIIKRCASSAGAIGDWKRCHMGTPTFQEFRSAKSAA